MTRRAKEKRRQRVIERMVQAHGETSEPEQSELAQLWDSLVARVAGASNTSSPSKLCWKSSNVPVKPASIFEIPIAVEEANSTLEYHFSTNDYDIAFGVLFVNAAGETCEVIPPTRCDSHLDPIRGAHVVHEPGTVLMRWDNSYSWVVAKELQYSIQLVRPGHRQGEGTRSQRALSALHETRALLDSEAARRTQLEGSVSDLERSLTALQAQLREIQEQISSTETSLQSQQEERQRLLMRAPHLEKFVAGLCIRCPDPPTFALIFSFGSPQDKMNWALTCRDWLFVMGSAPSSNVVVPPTLLGTTRAADASEAPEAPPAADEPVQNGVR